MARIAGAYNPEAETQTDFAPLPSGEYLAQIIESDMKPTKNNGGEYLELVYAVVDGEFKNRKVWARLNLINGNDQTVEIANRQMASIREATGVANPQDSQELHYKPHLIRVELIPAGTKQKNGYVTTKDGNEVKAWRKAEGAVQAGTPARAAAPAATPGARPWGNRAA
jgi:hypothetical protein